MADKRETVRVVMVSSTARDLPKHRDQVMSACLQQNLFPKMMEHLPASDANAVRASMRMVDEADLYVGVIGFRYGYVPARHKMSITEMEYERAGKRGIPRLMFLMSEDHALQVSDVETGPGAARVREFRQRIAEKRIVGIFSSPDDLRARVVQALSDFRASPDREELVASQIGTARYRVAVLNQCASLAVDEAKAVIAALQTQVHRDLATTWGIDAQIELVGPGERPPEKAWWLYLDDEIKDPGVLGYHDVNAEGLPLGRIGIQSSRKTAQSWSLTASHVLLQLLANPKGNNAVFEGGKIVPQEICRPCAGERWAYEINSIKVSDFVLPAWFESYRQPRKARFDYCGNVTAPFQVLPGGYMTYFENAELRTAWGNRNKPINVLRLRRQRKPGTDANR